ncbi:hypothetical protein ACHAXS_012264 [Conticribra weissflogii]
MLPTSRLQTFDATGNARSHQGGGPHRIRHHAPTKLLTYLSLIVAGALITYVAVFVLYIDDLPLERGYEARIPEENEYYHRAARVRYDNMIGAESNDGGDAIDFPQKPNAEPFSDLTNMNFDAMLLHKTRDVNRRTLLSAPRVFAPVDERWLHNGRVVRELSHRVLSRNIAQSNVVVMSPDFETAHIVPNRHSGYFHNILYPAKIAIEQGHTTHLLPTTTNLSAGWSSDSKNDESLAASIGWVLLAYFDTFSTPPEPFSNNVDYIFSRSRIGSWLNQTTITYIVFPVKSKATIHLSFLLANHEYKSDMISHKQIEITGLTAAETLLTSKYKLQLLASSHYFDPTDDRGGDEEAYYYGPNALFKSVNEVHRFLYERASHILQIEAENVVAQFAPNNKDIQFEEDDILEVQFHSLLFATQGLDLAIPSRSSYVDLGKHKKCSNDDNIRLKRCDPKLDARALGDDIKMECPKRHRTVGVRFLGPEDNPDKLHPESKDDTKLLQRFEELTGLEKKNGIILDVDKRALKESDEAELWMGGSSPEESEAVCVRLGKESLKPPRVSCTTRIVPKQRFAANPKPNESRPNLMVVLIDPFSRQQMLRSLPNTYALLNMLGFTEFEQYTAVGNNSGPNQAALYSGMPLIGREGIRTSSSHKAGRKWIWDRLNDEGYVTMKAEDGCIANSNMVQSIQPETHHGEQLHEMFCFDYDRPNCLGSQLAAEHLIQYTRQFIATYNRKHGEQSTYQRPWAAFVSFIDSHEDTLTLASYLDDLLVEFIQDVPVQNTLFLFTSDHGLHYGAAFQSTAAKIERATPLLHIRMPSKGDKFLANSKLFVTPFDVHETILDVVLGYSQRDSVNDDSHGISLVTNLPPNRLKCNTTISIPSDFCNLFEFKADSCEFMTDPPSIFSFYSDIPRQNRPKWPKNCPRRRDHKLRAFQDDSSHCHCATNERQWFPCSNMTRDEFHKGVNFSVENFSMRSCYNHDLDRSLEFEIHVKENNLVSTNSSTRSKATERELSDVYGDTEVRSSFQAQPNIIFLEIDSVSLSFSERHFPRTWSLLNKHRIITPNNDDRTNITCPTGWCAGAFNKTSVVGQNSIINQLAALSGCMDHPWDSENVIHYSRDGKDTYCPKSDLFNRDDYNFDGDDDVSHFHWIFAVARKLGYVTFFGEEFCYEDSPYVVQGQSVFDLDVDLSLEKIFCHLSRMELISQGLINSERLFGVEYDTKNIPDTCFDSKSRGDIGLEFISQMWDAYSARPKFGKTTNNSYVSTCYRPSY